MTSVVLFVTSATKAYCGESAMPLAFPMLGIVALIVLVVVSITTTLLSGDWATHTVLVSAS